MAAQISAGSVRGGNIDLSFTNLFSPTQLTETPERSRQTGSAAER